ncbi:MAG: hypothetical protein ACT6FD_04280 [Methanosarcinaceae archaeon]
MIETIRPTSMNINARIASPHIEVAIGLMKCEINSNRPRNTATAIPLRDHHKLARTIGTYNR